VFRFSNASTVGKRPYLFQVGNGFFMIGTDIPKRETRDLWVAIAIALSLGVYHLLFNIISFLQYISYQYYQWVSNLLFFWILALLLVAYRRWRNAVYRQRKLRNILASIKTEVIMVVDSHRRIQMVNESVNIFGFSPEEVINKTTDLLYLDRRVDKNRPNEIRDSINKVGFHIGQATGLKRTGETFPLEIMTVSLKGSEGVVVVIRDITERKRAEEAILQAKQTSEFANEEKSKLLVQLNKNLQELKSLEALRDNLTNMIVHDMRNPLQAILSSAQLLEMFNKPTMSEKNKAKIKDIVSQSKLLATMINSLLDVSRL
jgi:PAS domain S-box-containing protein